MLYIGMTSNDVRRICGKSNSTYCDEVALVTMQRQLAVVLAGTSPGVAGTYVEAAAPPPPAPRTPASEANGHEPVALLSALWAIVALIGSLVYPTPPSSAAAAPASSAAAGCVGSPAGTPSRRQPAGCRPGSAPTRHNLLPPGQPIHGLAGTRPLGSLNPTVLGPPTPPRDT